MDDDADEDAVEILFRGGLVFESKTDLLKTIGHLQEETAGVQEPRSLLAPIPSDPIHFVMPLYHRREA